MRPPPPPDQIDMEGLRLPAANLDRLRQRPPNRPPRHRPGEKFLKGPVPWAWLEKAGRLPGKALLVGLLLWREVGCLKGRTVHFRQSGANVFGLHADTFKRGVRALAGAGLVTINRQPGRALEVTVRQAGETPP